MNELSLDYLVIKIQAQLIHYSATKVGYDMEKVFGNQANSV
jgi:hypothetical protein